MKKLTVLSMIAAALLLTACGDSATGAEAKAATETKTEAPMKCGEGKCGDAMKKDTAAKCGDATEKDTAAKCGGDKKSATDEAKDAVSHAAEKVKDAASETVTKATDAVKDAASSAVDKVKEATAAVTAAVSPDAGKTLYAKCAGCHGADAKTKAMGKSGVIAGQSAADLETKLHGYKAGTLNLHGMGMLMKGQVASMSDDDIKAIAAYMAGL